MGPLPGWAIIKPEEKKKEGVLEMPDSAQNAMQQGVILEINPIWVKDGHEYDYSKIVKSGDKVAFRKYYDNDLEIEGKKVKVVHIENIFTLL